MGLNTASLSLDDPSNQITIFEINTTLPLKEMAFLGHTIV